MKNNKFITFFVLILFLFTLPGCAFSAPSDRGSVNKAKSILNELETIEVTENVDNLIESFVIPEIDFLGVKAKISSENSNLINGNKITLGTKEETTNIVLLLIKGKATTKTTIVFHINALPPVIPPDPPVIPPDPPVIPPDPPVIPPDPPVVPPDPPVIPPDPPVVPPVIPPANSYNVINYGATGNDLTDDTIAINKAIQSAAAAKVRTVYIPKGTYYTNLDGYRAIVLLSNIDLILAPDAIIQGLPTSNYNYAIIRGGGISNSSITGGKLIGDRKTHTVTTGEHGMGISLTGSNNVTIKDIYISDCWGDGIYIGANTLQNHCANIIIDNVICDNNRRQGLSIITVKNILVQNSTFKNTNGTNPQAGIDMEPNNIDQYMQDVVIQNCKFLYNKGYGLMFGLGHYEGSSNLVTVTANNNYFEGNGVYGGTGATGTINWNNINYSYLVKPGWHCLFIIEGVTYKSAY